MKKIEKSKQLVLPSEDNFMLDNIIEKLYRNAKGTKGKAFALALFMLFMAGCGQKSNNANTNAKPETTIEAPLDTPMPAATPEPTMDPETARQVEEAKAEEIANDYYKRLSANTGYPNDYNTVLEMVKRFNGNFSSLQNLQGLDSDTKQSVKVNYYNEMVDFMIDDINTMINNVVKELFEGQKTEYSNSETGKIFFNNTAGVETLNLIESMGGELRQSINDFETFKIKATAFQTLIATLYLENSSLFNGMQLTNLEDMSPEMETALRLKAQGYMAIIQMVSSINLTEIGTAVPGSEKCYSTTDIINALSGSLDCTVASWPLDTTTEILIKMDLYQAQNMLSPTPTLKP